MFQFNFPSRYAHSIRENLYECVVPDEATLSPEYVKTFGVHSTGFKDADEQLRNRTSRVVITIPTILNYYVSGIDVVISNDKDIIEIHQLVTGYLDEWRYHIEHDVNIRVTEFGDFLRDLEDFNQALYGMLTFDEYQETLPKAPEFFVRPLDIRGGATPAEVERPRYRDQYGSMISILREREKFENR